MPNHVYCSMKFHYHDDNGEMIEKIYKSIKGEDSEIDFNRIIKQPKGIQDARPEVLSRDEYDWNVENWGTKWNAYDTELRTKDTWKLVINFQTAWSAPFPIINKLMEIFPDVSFVFICADDGGWFAYHISKDEDGIIKKEWTSDNDDEGSVRSTIYEALNNCY